MNRKGIKRIISLLLIVITFCTLTFAVSAQNDIYSSFVEDGTYYGTDYLYFSPTILVICFISIISVALIIGFIFKERIVEITYCSTILFCVCFFGCIFEYSRQAFFISVLLLSFLNSIPTVYLFITGKACKISKAFPMSSVLIIISYTVIFCVFYSTLSAEKIESFVLIHSIGMGVLYVIDLILGLISSQILSKLPVFILVGKSRKTLKEIFSILGVSAGQDISVSLKKSEDAILKLKKPVNEIRDQISLEYEAYKLSLREKCADYRDKKDNEIEKCQKEVEEYKSKNDIRFYILNRKYEELLQQYYELQKEVDKR